MNKVLLASLIFFVISSAKAQDDEAMTLGKKIDEITYDWDLEADNLNSYAGLSKFCVSAEYRDEVVGLLNEIHHYDSVLYDRLVKAARFNKTHELEKTLKEIEKFEKDYDMRSFIHFLHEECVARNDLEKHAKELKNDIGEASYDSQVYLLETELNKFIKHVTRRVDHIREHAHHLHVK